MKKKVAIVQSSYIPWKGYFDLINLSDEFILLEDVQYTKRDWRNRNRIKTPKGLSWLTIPVQVKERYFQNIKDTIISDFDWNQRHWKAIIYNYSKAKYFKLYREIFEQLYLNLKEKFLSKINYQFISVICGILNINTKISWSMDYHIIPGKTERLLELCKQAGATEYISGPSAKDYIDAKLFNAEGIKIRYMNYSGYPQYTQLFPPFLHNVSIIDLILNEGPDAYKFMRSF